MTIKNEIVEIIDVEPIEEVAVEEVEPLVTFKVAKAPIQIGENVCCTADIGELAILLGLTARQMVKLLNKDLIRGVCWNKEANADIKEISHYMREFEVCGFTTYTTS